MSTPADLPRSVSSFLRTHVDHVIKLRFLIALHGAPGGATTVSLAARAIDVPKSQIRDMANELVEAGLARMAAEQIQLDPTTIDDRLALAELASWYGRDRNAITDALRALGRADGA